MNARQRIDGMVADWAKFPIGINDRGVPVLGKYHGHLVCEHADGSFYELAQTVLRLNRITEQTSKKRGSLATLSYSEQGNGLAFPMSATVLHDTLGDSAG
jgi:hypothetical protein